MLCFIISTAQVEKFGPFGGDIVFLQQRYRNMMDKAQVIDNIRQVASSVLPQGSKLFLYGSRARGDAREDSDWDFLLLLDKAHRESTLLGNYLLNTVIHIILFKATETAGLT